MQVIETPFIQNLVEDPTLFIQVAEVLSGGDIGRALLNKTVMIDVPRMSMQEHSKCSRNTVQVHSASILHKL